MRRQSPSFPNCSYVLCHICFFFPFETQWLLELKSLIQCSLSKIVISASSTSEGCLFHYTIQHPLVSAVAVGRTVRQLLKLSTSIFQVVTFTQCLINIHYVARGILQTYGIKNQCGRSQGELYQMTYTMISSPDSQLVHLKTHKRSFISF